MNQILSSDEIVEGGMHAAATDAVLQPNAFVITPVKINVRQSALDDLTRRLEMTRWPTRETVSDWSQGVPLARVLALVDYWRTTYETGAVARRGSTPSANTAPRSRAWASTSSTCAPGIRTPCRSCSATAGRGRSSNSPR